MAYPSAQLNRYLLRARSVPSAGLDAEDVEMDKPLLHSADSLEEIHNGGKMNVIW